MTQQKIIHFLTKIKNKIPTISLWMMSGFCGLILSLTIVSTFHGNENISLMASVANLNNNHEINAHFSSHILLQDQGEYITLILGTELENVDIIEGIIAFDWETNLELTHPSLQNFTPGMYKFSLPFNWKNINKWTIIAQFWKNTNISTPIVLTDTQFISKGIRYNLSNEVK